MLVTAFCHVVTGTLNTDDGGTVVPGDAFARIGKQREVTVTIDDKDTINARLKQVL